MNCYDCNLNSEWQSKVIKVSCILFINLFIIWVCHFKTSRQIDSLDDCLILKEKNNETYTVKRLSFMSFRLRSSFWAKESDR